METLVAWEDGGETLPLVEKVDESAQALPEAGVPADVERRSGRERDLLEAMLRHSPVGVAVVDTTGNILRMNEQLVALLPLARHTNDPRRPPDAPRSLAAVLVRDCANPDVLMQWLLRSMRSGTSDSYLEYRTGDLERKLRIWLRPVDEHDGNGPMLLMCEDATYRASPSISKALIEADDVVAEREQHGLRTIQLAKVTHELRTPLHAISGLAQVMAGRADVAANPDLSRYVGLIHDAGKHLGVLVDDLLTAARTEMHDLAITREMVDLSAATSAAIELMRHNADQAGISIHLYSVDQAPIWGDPTRVRQVLLNLIGNGIKYNHRGGRLDVRVMPSGTFGDWAIEVEDTGPGIETHEMNRVFEPFHRLGKPDMGIGGAGLGMFVTRELVNAMRGHIGVSSHHGEGTTFRVEFKGCLPE